MISSQIYWLLCVELCVDRMLTHTPDLIAYVHDDCVIPGRNSFKGVECNILNSNIKAFW